MNPRVAPARAARPDRPPVGDAPSTAIADTGAFLEQHLCRQQRSCGLRAGRRHPGGIRGPKYIFPLWQVLFLVAAAVLLAAGGLRVARRAPACGTKLNCSRSRCSG
jgi:hypothetical protein